MTEPRGSDFRTRATRTSSSNDPLGKAALFSDAGAESTVSIAPADAEGRGASHLFSHPEARSGTLVVDCSACGRHTRVTYAEFAALHVPVWLWLPAPLRTHRHWLRCPACRKRTWLRAHWLD
jgi:uncharacterized protein with PIN domain